MVDEDTSKRYSTLSFLFCLEQFVGANENWPVREAFFDRRTVAFAVGMNTGHCEWIEQLLRACLVVFWANDTIGISRMTTRIAIQFTAAEKTTNE